jgi:phosphopantothenoylcysteine decarboxylase/phosphopantothenate--cysteine ligase
MSIELTPTVDVLAGLSASRRADQTLVGFAAEHGEGSLAHARAKLTGKGLDAIVLNDISRAGIGFDAEENEVTIITRAPGGEDAQGAERHVARAPKAAVAAAVLDAVEGLRDSG